MNEPETSKIVAPVIKGLITPTDIADALKKVGYRANIVEHEKFPQVQSAAQGLGFFVGFGNSPKGQAEGFADYSFHCWITIQGELPPQMIDSWNQTKRFARLYRQGQLLILTMDVIVAGGVTEEFLCAQSELWDRVIHDFIHHIKQPHAATEAPVPSKT